MQAIGTSALRDEALARLSAGRRYEFLALANSHLQAEPDDAYVQLMVVRSYLELGLIAAARDALKAAVRQVDVPELDDLSRSLAKLSESPIPWATLTTQFEANLSAIPDRRMADAIRDAWSGASARYELFRDRNGHSQVRERDGQGVWSWFPILCNHEETDQNRALPPDIQANFPGPYLFEGVGLGGYFERVYHATKDTFLRFCCTLFLVEQRPERLGVALHLRDWTEILRDPRVRMFVGPGCMKELRQVWDHDFDLPFPVQVITTGSVPPNSVGAVKIVREAASDREITVRGAHEKLNLQYANRTIDVWARRFNEALSGPGKPLRVLAAVSIHTTFLQHSMRDAKRALEALGHEVVLLTEKTTFAVVGPMTYYKAIAEFDPDLFFVLDHLRPEIGALIPSNLPVLTWDQDQLPHVLTRKNLSGLADHDYLVGCSKLRCVSLGLDAKQCRYERVPTCPEQFSGDPLNESEFRQYQCDVSYVSHASQTPPEFHRDERKLYRDPALVRLLDCIYEQMPKVLAEHSVTDGFVTRHLLEAAMAQTGVVVKDEALRTRLESWYIWRLADRIFRHQALEWAADYVRATRRSFRIYGNGWEKHPSLAEFAAGPASNDRELLCIYRASRINLQLMPGGFIHQRALDGLAAGGFFLTRRTPGDMKGRVLRDLLRRMNQLGITDNNELLNAADAGLQRLLRAYVGPWSDCTPCEGVTLYEYLRMNAELVHADEAFEDLPTIAFNTAEELAAMADAFLADESTRLETARRMREVVTQSFSYRAAIDRFLRNMTDFLSHRAAQYGK